MTEETVKIIPVEEQINQELVKHNVTETLIAGLKEKYLPLKLKDLNDKETYVLIKDARKECKSFRVLAKKVCEKGREDALATQKAWVAKEKDVTGRIGEVEDHLEKQEKDFEAEQEKQKAQRKRQQEEQLINRQAALNKMGVLYSDGNFILNEVSFEMALIKECDEDVWEEQILPKFRAEYEKVEAERIEADRKKLEQEEEFKRQQKALQDQKEELERREADLKKAEEDRLQKENEDKERRENEARERQQDVVRNRINQLNALGLVYNVNEQTHLLRDVNIHYTEVSTMSTQEWDEMIIVITPRVEQIKEEAEEKRLADIEEQKRIAGEEAAKKERERIEEEQRLAEVKRKQAEEKKAQELLEASEKEKWQDIIRQLDAVVIHEMKSGQYRKKAAILREKLEEVKAL